MAIPLSSSHGAPAPDAAGVSLLGVAAAVSRRRWFILVMARAGGVVGAAWSLIATPRFRSQFRIALEERAGVSLSVGLAALAQQFGGGAGGAGTRSLAFYADLLTSNSLLEPLARDSFVNPDEPGTRKPLVDILNPGGAADDRRVMALVNELREHRITTTTNDRTGTISAAVMTPDPNLSAAVAGRLYQRLELFNTRTRRTSASERVAFAEQEFAKIRDSLAAAEAVLRSFLEENRGGMESARLSMRRQQIQRRVTVLQQVYSDVANELQEARIALARDLPVFNVIEEPRVALNRSYPLRKRTTLFAAILAGLLATAWVAFSATGWSVRRLDPAGYEALRSAWQRRG